MAKKAQKNQVKKEAQTGAGEISQAKDDVKTESSPSLNFFELFYLQNSQDPDHVKAAKLGVSLDFVTTNANKGGNRQNFMNRDPKRGFAVMTRVAAEQPRALKGVNSIEKRSHIHRPITDPETDT